MPTVSCVQNGVCFDLNSKINANRLYSNALEMTLYLLLQLYFTDAMMDVNLIPCKPTLLFGLSCPQFTPFIDSDLSLAHPYKINTI